MVRVKGSSEQTSSRRRHSNSKHVDVSSPKKRGDSNSSKHVSPTPKTIMSPASSHHKKKNTNMAAETPKERRRRIDLSPKHSYSKSMEERIMRQPLRPLSDNSTVYGQITSTPLPPIQSLSVFQAQKINPAERMLVSVTVMGSIWKVRFITSAQATVKGVIGAALAEILKEGRKLSAGFHVEAYELYISQFSLQSLDMDSNLFDLGVRSFVLRGKTQLHDSEMTFPKAPS